MTEPTCPEKGGKLRRPRLARALVAPCVLRSHGVSAGQRCPESRSNVYPALGRRAGIAQPSETARAFAEAAGSLRGTPTTAGSQVRGSVALPVTAPEEPRAVTSHAVSIQP